MTPRLAAYGRVVGLVASAWMSRSSDILQHPAHQGTHHRRRVESSWRTTIGPQASIAAGVGAMFAGRIGADLTALYRAQATVEKIRGFMAPRAENDQ